jgi:predicted acylesterase/phospholipase RssA
MSIPATDTKHTEEAQKKAALIKEAIEFLRGRFKAPAEVLKLADDLKGYDEFGYARRILAKSLKISGVETTPQYLKIVERYALNTYKDVNEPLDKRLDDALKILREKANLAATTRQETLGLAGAIYKRKWEADNQKQHLEDSLHYYERGYQQGPQGDQGYTGINAAFLCDWLAYLEARSDPARAQVRTERAREIREDLIVKVPPLIEPPPVGKKEDAWLRQAWFFYSTVGEAYFGLGRYCEAYDWLVVKPREAAVRVPDWEFETTARQLASMARLTATAAPNGQFERTVAWQEFTKILCDSAAGSLGGVSSEAVWHGFTGKVGLALSGGGFRASLFHIGVLAKLAELDVLRRVEVLSCVSGGSIVGAQYYLEVRRLLESKPDEEITREDYIEIVRRLEESFVAGVQRNIRTRVTASFKASLKMILGTDYSRTLRLGELYEEELFSRVDDRPDADKSKERYLHELLICPSLGNGQRWDSFKPKLHNWRRSAKAPILILNATTLNTGHVWQFTATYMGESPATIHSEIDSVYRLRRKFYTDEPHSPENPQRIRLGHAVAASSCVPVLFEPVVLNDLYERRSARGAGEEISVRLVDGGVCDNQGVAGLLEQDCNLLLVSDGSGQMGATDRPGIESLLVALRSNTILQARVRGTQYRELDARHRSLLLRGLMFMHLKKDLDENTPVDWKNCPPYLKITPSSDTEDLTSYGIAKDVQKQLAQLRTDLDTFCDLEAFALMTSGYLMTETEYEGSFGVPVHPHKAEDWRFLQVKDAMKNAGAERTRLETLLDAGSSVFFKVWKLSPGLKRLSRALIVLSCLLGLAALGLAFWSALWLGDVRVIAPETLEQGGKLLTYGLIGVTVMVGVLALLLVCLVVWLTGVTRSLDSLARVAIGLLLLLIGYPTARLYLWLLERRYIEYGRLK